MPNSSTYTAFFDRVKSSINDGTFAKLTLAKTMGNPELKNIYVRGGMIGDELGLAIKLRFQTEEQEELHSIDESIFLLTSYLNNPFLSALLFTTEADVTMKLNKKRVARITEQSPTFKNADLIMLEFQSKAK
jgi:hypothetical protein